MQPDSKQVGSDTPRVWAAPWSMDSALHWLLSVTLEGVSRAQSLGDMGGFPLVAQEAFQQMTAHDRQMGSQVDSPVEARQRHVLLSQWPARGPG